MRQYRIGWAPDDWDALVRALDVPDDVLRRHGLGFLNKRNRQPGRLPGPGPVPDLRRHGDAVAFGGRMMPGGDGPKYKNSPETPLYQKTKVLYGLNWAKGDIVKADEVIVCEGYTDVIGFARAGVPGAVATCGTALTEDHVRAAPRFARRLVLAFDADAAGRPPPSASTSGSGKYELEVAVADLPPGDDPADLAQRDPDALPPAVDGAEPFLRVPRRPGARPASDLDSPEGRARAADAALAVIAEHPNELVRDQY